MIYFILAGVIIFIAMMLILTFIIYQVSYDFSEAIWYAFLLNIVFAGVCGLIWLVVFLIEKGLNVN